MNDDSMNFKMLSFVRLFKDKYNSMIEMHAKECGISKRANRTESNVFANCTSLKTIILPECLSYFGYYVFQNSAINSINIPVKNLKYIKL